MKLISCLTHHVWPLYDFWKAKKARRSTPELVNSEWRAFRKVLESYHLLQNEQARNHCQLHSKTYPWPWKGNREQNDVLGGIGSQHAETQQYGNIQLQSRVVFVLSHSSALLTDGLIIPLSPLFLASLRKYFTSSIAVSGGVMRFLCQPCFDLDK